jgi:hypothetical protein
MRPSLVREGFSSGLMCQSMKFILMSEIRPRAIRIKPGVAVLAFISHAALISDQLFLPLIDKSHPILFVIDAAFQKGMKLPGSRPDVIRSRSSSGPSPVGGSYGGTDSQKVMTLDDFEFQAVYYNMACANSRLGKVSEAVVNLEKAFQNGFDNYSTVRGDPDLDVIKESRDYKVLMDTYDGKGGGFNPFGIFSKN